MSQTKAQLVEGLNINTSAPADALVIDSSGNMGVGTTSPQHRLSVERDIGIYRASSDPTLSLSVGGTIASPTKTYNLLIDDSDSDKLQIRDGSTARITLDSSGNVGIGTSSPTRKLEIHDGSGTSAQIVKINSGGVGLLTIQSGTTSESRLEFGSSDNDDAGYIYYDNDDDVMKFGINGAERLRVDSSGRLLVGTTNAVAFGSRQVLAVANGTTGGVLSLYNSTTATANTRISSNPTGSEINDIGIHAASTNGSIIAYTNNDTERLRIDSSGRLLVGATSPYVSDANFQVTNDTNAKFVLNNPGNATYSLAVGTDNALAFKDEANGAERMRLDINGNVLIGHSTSSLATPLSIAVTA
ncbi:MAG: hypothetical protein CL855_00730, partial [Cryomorphaceae bacterium]|nr:hypothetical protein [Cryomorphaceae bacterium]